MIDRKEGTFEYYGNVPPPFFGGNTRLLSFCKVNPLSDHRILESYVLLLPRNLGRSTVSTLFSTLSLSLEGFQYDDHSIRPGLKTSLIRITLKKKTLSQPLLVFIS